MMQMSANKPKSGSTPPPAWTFFRQWLKNPLAIAALSPSSRRLARQMVGELPSDVRRVIELGGGTGVFTRALLEHGINSQDLLVLELNDALYRILQTQFPDVNVVCGDARELKLIVERTQYAAAGPADAVLSGLGLLSMSRQTQKEILQAAFSVLSPAGCFIQFTYGPISPVQREVLAELGLAVRRGGIAWLNAPPASVYVYTRSRSKAINAVRAPAK